MAQQRSTSLRTDLAPAERRRRSWWWFARSLLAFVARMLASMALVFWLLGVLLSDRFLLTQVVFWVPSIVLPVGALVLAGFGRALAPKKRGRSGRRGRRLGYLPVVGSLAVVYVLMADWRVYRVVPMLAAEGPAGGRSLSLLHWNVTPPPADPLNRIAYTPPDERERLTLPWSQRLPGAGSGEMADVCCITSLYAGHGVAEALDVFPEGYTVHTSAHLAVYTHLPVLKSASFSLQIPAPENLAEVYGDDPPMLLPIVYNTRAERFADPGWLFALELDATEQVGRPMVLWFIDLPSDPRLPRMSVARLVERRVAQLRADPAHAGSGLLEPDLVVGDFNIPRGSASLGRIAPGMTHAHVQAGVGPDWTWPQPFPFLHIDHVFVGPSLRASSYETVPTKEAEHEAQRVTVVRDD